MGFVGLVIVALAVWQFVEVIHHGSIFAPLRAWAVRNSSTAQRAWRRFAAELILCPFCLSHWASAVLTILAFLASGPSEAGLGMVVLYWLAATRLANLANDVCHPWCRSPRGESPQFWENQSSAADEVEVSVSFQEEESHAV